MLPGAQPDLSKLTGPVLGHYAENDGWATPDAANALEQQIQDAGKQVEFHNYTGAKHAFMNPSPEVPKAGKLQRERGETSWERTLAFFKKHLA